MAFGRATDQMPYLFWSYAFRHGKQATISRPPKLPEDTDKNLFSEMPERCVCCKKHI